MWHKCFINKKITFNTYIYALSAKRQSLSTSDTTNMVRREERCQEKDMFQKER